MKNFFQLFMLFIFIQTLQAQPLFTSVHNGQVVSTPSDSRSVNWVDVNGDGLDDLFISNGPKNGQNNLLYINNGDASFTPRTGDPIVMDNSPSDGASFADTDNDGDLDAFVVTWYGKINYFYQNQGAGNFTHIPAAATGNVGTFSETASWGDYDNDGRVDLYITNSEGAKKNMLYHNNGNNQFTRIETGAAVTETDLSRGVNWTDYDNDGDADLFVTNENFQADDLYRNDGNGQFTKITTGPLVTSGLSTMSASWGDIDNDGDLDVFVANSGFFEEQPNLLFKNNGNGTFTEITPSTFLSNPGCSYGSSMGDIDNDGDLDLAVANGYCNGNIVNFLYLNDGQGNFTRAPQDAADLSTPCSYGIAMSDYDLDGFLDLAIATCKNTEQSTSPSNLLYRNAQSPAQGGTNTFHWLKVKLEGVVSNRSAIGAKVRVKTSPNGQTIWQMREISAQSGYCGQNSLVAHFGLETAESADSVLIEWPSGYRQVLIGVQADQQILVLEANTTGVENPSVAENLIRIFPNPAQSQVNLSANWKGNITQLNITLIDSLGRTVLLENLRDLSAGEWERQLDLHSRNLTPGNYFMRLTADDLTAVFPLVIR